MARFATARAIDLITARAIDLKCCMFVPLGQVTSQMKFQYDFILDLATRGTRKRHPPPTKALSFANLAINSQ
jgi:hypothetical protein